MATAISLDYQLSPPNTCRVEVQPTTMKVGMSAVQKGSQNYTNPGGIVYHQYGATMQDYNQGLRMPQMRTFLGPEIFNGGCVDLYCKDSTVCPHQRIATSSVVTNTMFDNVFAPQCDFTGNNAPPPCFAGKCSGYDSTVGWQIGANGKVQWQQEQ